MDTHPSGNTNGFDIYPLIYKCDPPRKWYERRPDRSYRASVMICREGEEPRAENGRIFRVPAAHWVDLGQAKRAAVQHAEDIVAGRIPGETVNGL
jgi:hypothetical protein